MRERARVDLLGDRSGALDADRAETLERLRHLAAFVAILVDETVDRLAFVAREAERIDADDTAEDAADLALGHPVRPGT